MSDKDLARLCHLLAQLFPGQMTKELGKFAAERFKEFEPSAVEAAIKAHRATHEFITWPQLIEGCRAAMKSKSAGEENMWREGTWADVFRRQRPDLAKASDYEVVLRIHRGWWFKCTQSDSYRRQLEHSCISLLIRFGMPQADAEKWAAPVFEESPEFFRQCLEEIRSAASDPAQMALV